MCDKVIGGAIVLVVAIVMVMLMVMMMRRRRRSMRVRGGGAEGGGERRRGGQGRDNLANIPIIVSTLEVYVLRSWLDCYVDMEYKAMTHSTTKDLQQSLLPCKTSRSRACCFCGSRLNKMQMDDAGQSEAAVLPYLHGVDDMMLLRGARAESRAVVLDSLILWAWSENSGRVLGCWQQSAGKQERLLELDRDT